MTLDGGEANAADAVTVFGGSVLEGSGVVRASGDPSSFGGIDVRVGSILRPGLADEVGRLTLEGWVQIDEESTLSITLGEDETGARASSHAMVHGVLELLGTVEVTDALVLSELAAGDRFEIASAFEIVEGEAIAYVLPALAGGLSWETFVDTGGSFDTLTLQIVPEPGTGVLLLVGLVFVARRRADRR